MRQSLDMLSAEVEQSSKRKSTLRSIFGITLMSCIAGMTMMIRIRLRPDK